MAQYLHVLFLILFWGGLVLAIMLRSWTIVAITLAITFILPLTIIYFCFKQPPDRNSKSPL